MFDYDENESLFGRKREERTFGISTPRDEFCPHCRGTGLDVPPAPGMPLPYCRCCGGSGKIKKSIWD